MRATWPNSLWAFFYHTYRSEPRDAAAHRITPPIERIGAAVAGPAPHGQQHQQQQHDADEQQARGGHGGLWRRHWPRGTFGAAPPHTPHPQLHKCCVLSCWLSCVCVVAGMGRSCGRAGPRAARRGAGSRAGSTTAVDASAACAAAAAGDPTVSRVLRWEGRCGVCCAVRQCVPPPRGHVCEAESVGVTATRAVVISTWAAATRPSAYGRGLHFPLVHLVCPIVHEGCGPVWAIGHCDTPGSAVTRV